MKKNDVISMTCENLGADMEGVCRHEGMAVFVPGLLPGESAPVRVVKTEKRYAFGMVAGEISSPSPDRREPGCPAYPKCGGCSCRHMDYAATLRAKRQQVEDCFRRIGHLEADVPPVKGMEHPDHYRNKTALPVGGTAEHPLLGFYAPRSHRIIPAESCPNAMAPAADLASAFLGWMQAHRLEPYREETHTGLIRHLVIRVNRQGQAMVTVVVNGGTLPFGEELADRLAPLGCVSLILNENRERTNVILGRRFTTLWGQDNLEDTLCGLRFRLSPAAFFQVNPVQTEVLYQTALDFAAPKSTELVCDVYCGAGTISLMMARHAGRVIGIEVVPQAVENARENAARNGITNAEFHAGPAEELLPRLVEQGLCPDVIVVDPPRKGLELPVIEAMDRAAPKRLVYVSCNPATQARDAALLAERGWRIRQVQSVDMFCMTSGVENVMLMTK